jgi:hypothetical protein
LVSIEERDRWRCGFLRHLYDATDGEPGLHKEVNIRTICAQIDLDGDTCSTTAQWLVDRQFAEWDPRGGGFIGITRQGADKVEDDFRVAAGSGAADVASPADVRAVEAFLGQVALGLERGDVKLDATANATLDANKATIEAQLRSPEPSRSILRVAVGVMARLLEGATGSALGAAAVLLVQKLT